MRLWIGLTVYFVFAAGIVTPTIAQSLDGLCFPANACMGEPQAIKNNVFQTCESVCSFQNPVAVRDMNATLYDVACMGDWGSKKERYFVSFLPSNSGQEAVVVTPDSVERLEQCK